MAKIFAGLLAGLGQLPIQPPEAGQAINSKVHVFRNVITMASQPTTDTQLLARVPAGYVILGGELITDTSLGSATIAVGIAGTAAKYKAAAVLTATDTVTPYGKAAAVAEGPLTTDTEILATIATAALPSSGTLVSLIYAAKP